MASPSPSPPAASVATAATGAASPSGDSLIMLKRVPVIIIGCGQVAQALITQINVSADLHARCYGLCFDVLALADSSGFVLAAPGLDAPPSLSQAQLTAVFKHKGHKKGLSAHSLGSAGTVADLVSGVTAHTRCIVVDASGAEGTGASLLQALERGSAVVTANKKPMADTQALWDAMHAAPHRHRLRYESTVGAGTPIVAALSRVISSGDPVRQVMGSFSGTLGYVMSGLEAGKPYSVVIGEAVRLGYTEPDPRDDLGGIDVARKALILARMLGRRAEMKDVNVEPLYDAAAMGSLDVPAFLAALPTQDSVYAEKVAQAKESGYVLRYVANVEEPSGPISVGLMAVASSSPLGRLQGTENLCEIHTAIYGLKPLVIQGAGAGGAVTAVGVLSDMVEVAAMV